MSGRARPYADATTTGVALGLVLLASFVFAGRGLGASGAFADVSARIVDAVSPTYLAQHPSLGERLPGGVKLSEEWIVWEIVGVFLGAALSAKLSGRWGTATEGARRGAGNAIAGGILMGVGARFAYGCTSGLGLSGGALLATGAWLFIVIAFATAFLVSAVARASGNGAG